MILDREDVRVRVGRHRREQHDDAGGRPSSFASTNAAAGIMPAAISANTGATISDMAMRSYDPSSMIRRAIRTLA